MLVDLPDLVSLPTVPELAVPPLTLNLLIEAPLLPQWEQAVLPCVQAYKAGWVHFFQQVQQHQLLQDLSIHKPWEADALFVSNATMQQLNQTYRHKNAATDVLTFTLFADAADKLVLQQLPLIHLGAFAVSLEWAQHAIEPAEASFHLQLATRGQDGGNFTPTPVFIQYILERMIHGSLHLLGVTHDTDNDYNRVVEIQQHVLKAFTG
jgi:ssRNA-specific RNase YbeY (16S rRNA maturation enzyme)